MFHLILLVQESVRRGDLAAWNMLELLATVAVPNGRPDPPTQRFVCALVMGERVGGGDDDGTDASASATAGDGGSGATGSADCQPLLFKVRAMPVDPAEEAGAAGAGGGGAAGRNRGWSVWSTAAGRMRGASEAPGSEPQSGGGGNSGGGGGGLPAFARASVFHGSRRHFNSKVPGSVNRGGGGGGGKGDGEAGGPQARWQVSLDGLATTAPQLQASPGEVADYLRDEEALMRGMFQRYDRDRSGSIDRGELRLLCEDLGMIPALIDSTTRDLPEDLGFRQLLAWWQRNRSIFSVTGDIIMAAHAASMAALGTA
ncbi:unnamed protein product, partial [Phaeothamnion confervicola]